MPKMNIIASIEPALRKHEDEIAAEATRVVISGILERARLPGRNLINMKGGNGAQRFDGE